MAFLSAKPADAFRVLCIDRGSSSLKVNVYQIAPGREDVLFEGGVTTTAALLGALAERDITFDAVGHRVVFGGPGHDAPARVTPALLEALDAQVRFDPLHLPDALDVIRDVEATLPDLPQVVCFDTAFHRRMPLVAQRLPLPRELWKDGLRRYGFHGLSYESIVDALGATGSRGKLIVAHLGSGASLAAMQDGLPIDTTMGFSPLGGVMMGSRPGDLDPGALLYLLRTRRRSVVELDELLTSQSGLLGVSGLSTDMETLLEARASNAHAADAVELFVHSVKKSIGALAAVLGGIDTLVFTGGIGEHAAPVRSEIIHGLAHLGLELDPVRNAAAAAVISHEHSRAVVRVIAARENLMVARHTQTVVRESTRRQ